MYVVRKSPIHFYIGRKGKQYLLVSFTAKPDFLRMTQILKVCQIDHRFEDFGLMLLTIAAQVSLSDSQTQF